MVRHEIDKRVARIARELGRELPDADLIEFGARVWAVAVESSEAVLSMSVLRLGGTVEGLPTGRHNFLQRIDELRANEKQHQCYDCKRLLTESEATFNFGNRPLCKGGCRGQHCLGAWHAIGAEGCTLER